MKTKITLFSIILILLITSCKNGSKKEAIQQGEVETQNIEFSESDQKNEKQEKKKELKIIYSEDKQNLKAYYELPHIKEFYDWQEMEYTEPPALQYISDLTSLSYEELRLLRNEIFARNGYLFNDGFLRGYFNRYKWYMPIFDVDSFKVVLNNEERELINNILAEENKRKENLYIKQGNLNLLNSDLIVNKKQFVDVPDRVLEDFKKQNFSIVAANRAMPFYTYDQNAYQYIPHYITTDLYLFILHKYFSRFLEKLDENFMYNQLKEILENISGGLNEISNSEIISTIDWAKMYNALALYTIGDSLISAPEKYADLFEIEKENIDKQNGHANFIENKFVNYAELKPRGHYTKSEKLKKYFKTFKWISLNGINLNDDEQLKGLILYAQFIKNDSRLFEQYKNYVATVEKLAGKEDNLSLYDIINSLSTKNIKEALSDKNVASVRKKLDELDKEKVKRVFGESFQTEEKNIKRVYFLSSTYSISGEIFSNLVHIDWVNSKRPFPRGLDVPAVFGNKTAQDIIVNEYQDNKKWPEYLPKLKKLQDQFKNFNDWDHNYGFKGVQTALASSSEQTNYPDFMKTDAYNRKELSTTLSSWTHIKHDLILYQEKPFAAEAGQGGGPEPPQHYSYVEPNLQFWDSALGLIDWLEKLAENESTFNDELRRIKELGIRLKNVAYKQVNGEKVTTEEYDRLHYIGGTIEYILLGLLETDHIPERERSMALIADVYVYNDLNLNVAVGHADEIYAVVTINGEYYISKGAVFSYYEFKDKIYNDEEWRGKIKNNEAPKRPEWLQPIINNVEPLEGQMQFRYP